jgi:hypothetical protein
VANGTCYTAELTVSRPDQARWQSTEQTGDKKCIKLLSFI